MPDFNIDQFDTAPDDPPEDDDENSLGDENAGSDDSSPALPPPPQDAIPLGFIQVAVFQGSEDPTQHACTLFTDDLMKLSIQPWIEAAGAIAHRAATLSTHGYERTLELITAKALEYASQSRPHPPL